MNIKLGYEYYELIYFCFVQLLKFIVNDNGSNFISTLFRLTCRLFLIIVGYVQESVVFVAKYSLCPVSATTMQAPLMCQPPSAPRFQCDQPRELLCRGQEKTRPSNLTFSRIPLPVFIVSSRNHDGFVVVEEEGCFNKKCVILQ